MITQNDEYRKLINRIKRKISTELKDNFESNLMIVVDSREQENKHIIRNIQEKGLFYSESGLSFGDYSFYYDGVDYTKDFSIERKNSVNELISSLLEKRFEREFKRGLRTNNSYFEIVVESGSITDIMQGNYRNNIEINKIMAMIHSRQTEYNIPITFLNRFCICEYILGKIKYYIRLRMLKDELKLTYNIDYDKSIYF